MEEFLRRWPDWVGRAAAGWALLNAAVAGYWATGGERGYLFEGRENARLLTAVELLLVAVSLLGAVAAARPGRLARVPLLGLCAVAFLGTFGLAIGTVGGLATGSLASPLALLYQLFCLVGAVLAVGTYSTWSRVRHDRCARCGIPGHAPSPGPLVRPVPTPASRPVRLVAYLGMSGFLPWAVVKLVLGFGGEALGATGDEWAATFTGTPMSPLTRWLHALGIDITVLAAVVGAIALAALVHRWGFRLPRWLLLGVAWIGAPSLAVYGLGLVIAGALMLTDLLGTPAVPPFSETGGAWVSFFGGLAFGPLGLGFLVGAVSFGRRSRPRCPASKAELNRTLYS